MIIDPNFFEEHAKLIAQRRERLRQLGEWHSKEASRLGSRGATRPIGDQQNAGVSMHNEAAETIRAVLRDLDTPSVPYDADGFDEYMRVRADMLRRLRKLREWHLQEARRHDPRPPPDRSQESSYRSMADFHERAVETLEAETLNLRTLAAGKVDEEQLKANIDRLCELRDWHAQQARWRREELARERAQNRRNEKATFHDRAAETLYEGAGDLEGKDIVY